MKKIIILIILISSMKSVFSQDAYIDSLSIQLAFQKADSLKVDTSLYLIKKLYDSKEYDRALKYIIESEKLSNTITYQKGIAETTYFRALIYAKKEDYINAISGYTKSKALFNQLYDTLSVAKVNSNIGLIEIKRGNYTKGLQYSISAVKELEKRHLKTELKLAYSNLAKAYDEINDYDKAIEFNLKILEIHNQLNDNQGVKNSNIQLAKLYSISKEHRKAIQYYEKVISKLSTKSMNNAIKAEIYPKLGSEYLQFHEYEKASKYLIKGYYLNKKINNQSGLLESLNSLGDLNTQKARYKSAENQLSKAIDLANKLNNKEELLRSYKLMKSLDSTKEKFSEAFIWQRKYYDLKDSLSYNQTNTVTKPQIPLENLNYDLNFDKIEQPPKPILVESKKEIILEEKYNNMKLLFYVLIGALVIITTFLILTYIKRRKSLKHVRALKEENVTIELQNEAYNKQTKYLENANNVKDKLFSIVSHDLKDSLSSINGFIDLLKDGSLSREEFDDLIPELSENANNASLLLYNLLNWSKSQMQSLKPSPSLFDVQEVFEDKVKLVEQRMESKGISLMDHSLKDFAYADRSMFEIIIQNLLANALKFSKKEDTITISNHASNDSCIISIADSGVGISQQNIEKIFKGNAFTTMGTNNEKGTGLGLSICRELVELNGGKIWVESALNIGSTFYVQLPKSKVLQ